MNKLQQLDSSISTVQNADFNVEDLPHLVTAINQCFEEVDFTYKKLSTLIEKDPVLTNRIFNLVNSGIFNRPETIKNLDGALMLLGFGMIRNLIFSQKLLQLLSRHPLALQVSLSKRWLFTLKHAAAAMELAKIVKQEKPEEIFLAIIFSDIAAFILADKYHQKNEEVDEKEFYRKADKLKFVYGAKALKAWQFSQHTIQVFQNSHSPELTAMDIVRLAYYHIKGGKDLKHTHEFKKLPISIQLTFGDDKLLMLKEKEKTIQKLVTALS